MKKGGIILLEGADGSGKTTLARDLVKRHGGRYMHGRVWKDMRRWHAGMMRRALWLANEGQVVVVDRHWVSEFVYGPTFRGGPAYGDDLAREFDRNFRTHGLTVMCVPKDSARLMARHAALLKSRPEKFDNIERVVRYYSAIRDGNMFTDGKSYLDRYIRHGDFFEWNACLYDVDIDGARVGQFNDYAVDRMRNRR